MAKTASQTPRASGSIRPRGSSFQIRVYAGINPETGEPHYLTATRPDMKSAKTERDHLVASKRAPLTNGLFENAIRQWLDSREAEVEAGELAEDHVIPTLGSIIVGSLDQLLVQSAERLYAQLGKCRLRCGGCLHKEHYAAGQGNSRILRDLTGHQCGKRCKSHECTRASASMLRKIHGVITGTCSTLHRWGLIPSDTR